MLKPQIHQQSSGTIKTLFPASKKPFLHGIGHGCLTIQLRPQRSYSRSLKNIRTGFIPGNIKAISSITEKSVSIKAIVTVQKTVGNLMSSLSIDHGRDVFRDLIGQSLRLELVSAELDPKTGLEKPTIRGYAHQISDKNGEVKYESKIEVPPEFGEVGAILVENEHHSEMFIKDVVLDGFLNGPVTISCRSFVHPKSVNKENRVFFTNKSYLPSQTPDGLKRLREAELASLRGNGEGERQCSDRIYDYDVYNDIGDPDKDPALARPVLGGKERPYPRRCRTGRPRSHADPSSEKSASGVNYVPRDEAFSDIKQATFTAKTFYSVLHGLLPALGTALEDPNQGFPYFSIIESLYNEGIELPPHKNKGIFGFSLPRLVKAIEDRSSDVLCFETPETMSRDRFLWLRDEEFARQTLAGINPFSIQLVREWPLKSALDPEVYGPPESTITTEIVEEAIKGFMTVDEAMKQKKLFILDYHDLLLPYVEKVRELKGTTLYGSRTLFFLTPSGTLKPVAIELTRPKMDGKPQWKQVFRPSSSSTACWLWKLAKTHVLAHDSGIHQLVSHWLRTHCCTEPYIIATNRQLSAMHPIYRLLHPHFRYTMEINALARQYLINAEGVIESTFSPGKYSIELSSVAYDKLWRFDHEALPNDLIKRGLAVEDPSAPHGLRLTIEDYPYANDGLVLWDTIKQWVNDYVNHFYAEPNQIESDQELQEWWSEIRNVGHGDKKDEPWWPNLKTQKDLVEIVTTIVWVTSGHHAAVNFGQYTFGGYFPNRPTIARCNMPTEDYSDEEWKFFMEKPEALLMASFPSQIQATKVMAILDVLSNHSPDEEYLGDEIEPSWAADPIINAAFERFNGRLKELEGIVDERNANVKFMNRNGAGIVPYQLLKPFSEPGVTGKGVPYSISI